MTYRVGVVGFRRGSGPSEVFGALPDCEIAAVCDIDGRALDHARERFPGAALFTDYEEMLGHGLDIVLVASPVPLHAQHTIAALQAGCHVLQEVTLATSVEECHGILDAVLSRPRQRFMLAENCCYWGHVAAWATMWRQGLLGEFMYGEAEYVHAIGALLRDAQGNPTWRASLPPIHYCTHSLGPLLMVTGRRCVSAVGLGTGSRLNRDLGSTDLEVGLFQTDNGGVLKVLCAFGIVREPMFHYYSLYGTKGVLETARPPADLQTNAYLEAMPNLHGMIRMPQNYDVPGVPAEAYLGGHGTAEYFMVRAFMDAVRSGTPPPVDIYAALDMALPGLCAHESALHGGTPVPVPNWR
ncbi:MAG: Gfo/Idh/MocA family protein [Anaerolineae bacterium]